MLSPGMLQGPSTLIAISLACSLGFVARADAQTEEVVDLEAGAPLDEAARASFNAGQAAYEAGEFEAALTAFESGYSLSPRPEFLFNIASTHSRLHQLPEALSHFEQYLDALPDASNRAYVEREITRLEALLDAGRESPDPAHPPQDTSSSSGATLAAFGVGGAGLVTFAIAGTMALSSHRALADCREASVCLPGEGDAGRRRALVADIGLGVGVVGLAVGLILVLVRGRKDDATVSASPLLHRQGTGLSVGGRF